MVEQFMIDDINHERETLIFFLRQKRCIPLHNDLWNLSNDVVAWLMNPTLADYPKLCQRTADVSARAWDYIHGYLPAKSAAA